MSVAILVDSNSGITPEEAKKSGIYLLPMPFYIDEAVYYEDITMSQAEFYEFLEKKVDVKTSQPTPDSLMHNWREARVRRDWGETLLRMQYAFGG